MVLIRARVAVLAVLAPVATSGCGESLFDAHGGRGGGSGDIVMKCPAPCIADAAADFTASQGGRGDVWRYLDDRRDRTWAPMDDASGALRSADPADGIAACAETPSAGACAELPGALLVSSGASPLALDPAIEYTSPEARVIQLSFAAHAPAGGAAQTIRLYRNSREDVLVTAEVQPGATAGDRVVVDALAGDRFLIAVEPRGDVTGTVALQFFVSGREERFPSACQLAVSFDSAAGNQLAERCRDGAVQHWFVPPPTGPGSPSPASSVPPMLGMPPFVELGQGADLPLGYYYASGRALEPADELTVQLWVRNDAASFNDPGWAFSTLNIDTGLGLGVNFYGVVSRKLEVTGISDEDPLTYAGVTLDYPTDGAWHFLRVVSVRGAVAVCLDGSRVGSFVVPAERVSSTEPPYFGKNGEWAPYGAYFDGAIDDVRVLSTALPCD